MKIRKLINETDMIKIKSMQQKKQYAKYLIEKFGSKRLALEVINEMLKVIEEGSYKFDLKYVYRLINEDNYDVDMYEFFINK